MPIINNSVRLRSNTPREVYASQSCNCTDPMFQPANIHAEMIKIIRNAVHKHQQTRMSQSPLEMQLAFSQVMANLGSIVPNLISPHALAKPAIHACIAGFSLAASAKIAEFASNKTSHTEFLSGLYRAINEVHRQIKDDVYCAIKAEVMERGAMLSESEVLDMAQELIPHLSLKDMAKIALIGGTVFAGIGYASAGATVGLTYAGLTGVPAIAAQTAISVTSSAAGGALLTALYEKLLGMPQPPGTMAATASVLAAGQAMQSIFSTVFSNTNWLPIVQETLASLNKSPAPLAMATAIEQFDLKKRVSNLCTTSAQSPVPQALIDTRYRYRHNSTNTRFEEATPLRAMEEGHAGVSHRFNPNHVQSKFLAKTV